MRARFTAHRHHTMATVRRDGGPRISGTEVEFSGGELCLGMMPGTRRAADLRRDPRIALHSQCADPPEDDAGGWSGEAKLSGGASELPREPGGAADRFRIEVEHAALTYLDSGRLVIETWSPAAGRRRRVRD